MKKFFIIMFFIIMYTAMYGQIKSGFVFGFGTGKANNTKYTTQGIENTSDIVNASVSYKYNAMLGYKFRMTPNKKLFFYDFDIIAGIKKIESQLKIYSSNYVPLDFSTSSSIHYSFSTTMIANYTIFNTLYIGAGVEPTVYYAEYLKTAKFDLPFVAKVGYSFKYFDISLNGKLGTLNPYITKQVNKSNLLDLQFQMFIPFNTSN